MFHHFPIALISSTAGANNDGVLVGSVNESLLVARYTSLNFYPTASVYRIDRAGSSISIFEESALATSATPLSWSPFGTNVFSAGTVLKIYDSTDGVWATNPLVLSVGSITDLQSTGYKKFLLRIGAFWYSDGKHALQVERR